MNKVSSKHHWENVWKFSNNKESYNFPPSRIERAKDKLKTFIYNEYLYYINGKIGGFPWQKHDIGIFKVNLNRSEFLSSRENFTSD